MTDNKKELIFGSSALQHWFNDFNREPNNLNILTPNTEKLNLNINSNTNIEYFWNDVFYYLLDKNKHPTFVDIEFLLLIKANHIIYDNGDNWNKHLQDIIFLQNNNVNILKNHFDFYHQLKEFYSTIYINNISSIQPAEIFLSNQNITEKLSFIYDDDLILNENKFKKISYSDKICLIIEKSIIIALKMDIDFKLALKYLIDNLNSEFINNFIVFNINNIFKEIINNKNYYVLKYNINKKV